MKKKIFGILFLILIVSGGIFAFRGLSASAREMKLVKTDGQVHVSDETKQEKPVKKNMNLYSGYGVGTEAESYAWIDLDKTKLLKLDESSTANLQKDGRKLRIRLESGDIFFCVTKPLTEEEGLEFENSNTAMSIRGTTGIFRSISDAQSQLVLMEGSVALEDGQTVTTGQVADLVLDEDGRNSVTTRKVVDGDVPDFVLEIIEENEEVKNKILAGGGRVDYRTDAELMAIYGDIIDCYRKALSGTPVEYSVRDCTRYMNDINGVLPFRKKREDEFAYEGSLRGFEAEDPSALRGWQYAFFDINHDGWPELLIADNTLEEGNGIRDCWTTNGVEPKHAIWPPNYLETLKVTSTGYIAIETSADWAISAGDTSYYSIYTGDEHGWGEFVARTEEGGIAWGADWTGVVHDDLFHPIFKTNSKEEFDAYVAENFTPVPDLSLNWRSID